MNSQQLAEKAKCAARQAGPASIPKPGRISFFGLDRLETKGLGSQAGLWALVTLIVVFLAYPSPVNYHVGQVAGNTIRADHSFKYLDLAAMERKRLEAESQVPPVFLLDNLLAGLLEKQAGQIFQRARALLAPRKSQDPVSRQAALAEVKREFLALWNLPDDSPVWPGLVERRFDEGLEKRALELVLEIMANGFLDASASAFLGAASAITVINVSNHSEYIKPRLDTLVDQREFNSLMDIQARKLALEYGREETDLILALVRGLARPNLRPDQAQTLERRWQAAAKVDDIYVDIRPGQVIVQEGTVIDQEAMEKIKALQAGQSLKFNWLKRFVGAFLALFLFYNLVLILFSVNPKRRLAPPPFREQVFMSLIILLTTLAANAALVFGTSLSWDFDFMENHTIFFSLPLPAGAMLAGVFFGIRRATMVLILVAATIGAVIPSEGRVMAILYIVNGGIVAIVSLKHVTERKALVPASFWVAVFNCLTLMSLALYNDSVWGPQTVNNFLSAFACGFFSGVLTSGLIPLMEMAFGFNTNLKMLELGNLDRPILRELMLSAPGTYHHSVIVGAMVEAAAEAVGANPYVAKVGAYYHDIGKMKKPLYFVENQSGENRHDTLAPSMSALVLVGHVREGSEMGRVNRLPRVIIDIIEQHHGVSLMGFFHQKAKEQHLPGQPEVNEGDFRYPGPKPRSTEAGLVMLGDVCEAATRSLSEPTPLKIRNMVKFVVNQIFSDGQLDECSLKTSDIAVVVNVFTAMLIGIYHHRVAYNQRKSGPAARPSAAAPWPEGGKTKDYAHLSVEPSKSTAH